MTSDRPDGGYVVGVDIGGTFTDCVAIDSAGVIRTGKVPTRPDDRALSFFEAVEDAARGFDLSLEELLARCARVFHGTTTGTNALITRTGARVGLVTTVGQSDMTYLMKAAGRLVGLSADEMLDFPNTDKPVPLVPRDLIREVNERVDFDGDVILAMADDDARQAIRDLREQGVESVAISFLWSMRNSDHERRMLELAREEADGLFVSRASDLSVRIGEYERTMTCIINSYIGPLMERYVRRIESGAKDRGYKGQILYTQCAGGAITVEEVQSAPIRTVNSGPVSGVGGSAFFAELIGEPNVIVTDMGGTSFDVSVIREGRPDVREISELARFEVALPMVDVEGIGAGGGSIAWIDDSGRLQVGPQSATAQPGPACYGRGGVEPTVTDADVVLGVLDPDNFLHGAMKLDRAAAEAAVGRIATRLGLDLYEAAAGINRIVDNKMADLIRRMSVLRGLDPRNFSCFAFGGSGPAHAGAFAREIGVKELVIPLPLVASVWSAFGAATSDVSHVYQRWQEFDMPVDAAVVNGALAELEQEAVETLTREGFERGRIELRRWVSMKYRVQVFDVEVPVADGTLTDADIPALEDDFASVYDDLYGKGSGYREGGSQITGFIVRARGIVDKPTIAADEAESLYEWSRRDVYWDEERRFLDTPVLKLRRGAPDVALEGPLLVELPDTVVTLRPGQTARFDALGALRVKA